MSSHYDVIIIGTGAGGGTLAHRLAPSGKRILLLERGDYVPGSRTTGAPARSTWRGSTRPRRDWRDKDGKELHPHTNYWVGGNTKFYGAALFRLRREDFGELRHHGGVSPAWPIGYDELEPYYTEAEHLYQVHGERGEDPTEPPASAPYRYPAVSHEPRHPAAERRLRRARPAPVPRSARRSCSTRRIAAAAAASAAAPATAIPAWCNAKSDAQVVCVDPALEYSNVTLLTGAYVSRLETSASGREVTRVLVERDGAAGELHAPTSWSPPAARSTPRRCCSARRATSTRAGWPTAPTWWAGTTWATSTRC